MINWYPSTYFSSSVGYFSPRVQEILRDAWKWGLDSGDGNYVYYTDRYEINRFDHMTKTPYTQWTQDDSEIRWVLQRFDRTQKPSKLVETDLDHWEVEIDPDGDDVASCLVYWLKEVSREEGYELLNISEADLNIVQGDFTDSASRSDAGTGEFEPTGNIEFYGLDWTAKVDFSGWQQVKL